jgi:hypothetical protein
MSDDEFVRAVLTRSISRDAFEANAQRFVSNGRWRTMRRELQREVRRWIKLKLVQFSDDQQPH